MQVVVYRGGLAQFRIPDGWITELGEVGGGTFYRDEPDSATLRLNIMTFAPKAGAATVAPVSVLEGKARAKHTAAAMLPTGYAMVSYDDETDENGERVRTRFWELAQVLPSGHVRLAVFSLSASAARWRAPDVETDLVTIGTEVRSCQLATTLGEVP
ncbi:MAG: hypothetical protein QOH79_57 [Acidimicrobiaceae bacterium]